MYRPYIYQSGDWGKEIFTAKWMERWNTQMHSPIQGAAYCLDPEHFKDKHHENSEVMSDLETMCQRLSDTPEDGSLAYRQFAWYKARSGSFGKEEALKNMSELPSWVWWQLHGSEAPQLQRVAIRCLAQQVRDQ